MAPGFIDIHSHSDDAVLINPLSESKIRQGITTEVVGNCGYSLAPLAGVLFTRLGMTLTDVESRLTGLHLVEYLDRIEDNGTAVNIAALIGHGTVRGCDGI